MAALCKEYLDRVWGAQCKQETEAASGAVSRSLPAWEIFPATAMALGEPVYQAGCRRQLGGISGAFGPGLSHLTALDISFEAMRSGLYRITGGLSTVVLTAAGICVRSQRSPSCPVWLQFS